MTIQDIPTLNAALNATATVLITLGFIFIKQGKREAHRASMLTAGFVSAIFLVGYVTHKILMKGIHTTFGGESPALRAVYYTMRISHVIRPKKKPSFRSAFALIATHSQPAREQKYYLTTSTPFMPER